MVLLLRHLLGWVVAAFGSREDLVLENLALRQQLLAPHAKQPRRRLTTIHKLFWVGLRRLWAEWKKPFILGRCPLSPPDTVRYWKERLIISWDALKLPSLESDRY